MVSESSDRVVKAHCQPTGDWQHSAPVTASKLQKSSLENKVA